MKVGAWFDSRDDALYIRIRAATRAEARRSLACFARILLSLAPAELPIVGQAVLATVKDADWGDGRPVPWGHAPALEPDGRGHFGTGSSPLDTLVEDDQATRPSYWDASAQAHGGLANEPSNGSQSQAHFKGVLPDAVLLGPGTADGSTAPMAGTGRADLPTRYAGLDGEARRRDPRFGAWYDPVANELQIRAWGGVRGEFRRALAHLARRLQTVDISDLRAMGLAIQATLQEAEHAEGDAVRGGGHDS